VKSVLADGQAVVPRSQPCGIVANIIRGRYRRSATPQSADGVRRGRAAQAAPPLLTTPDSPLIY
jgi:hypothetical protein